MNWFKVYSVSELLFNETETHPLNSRTRNPRGYVYATRFLPDGWNGGVGGNLVPPGPGYKPCANGTRVYLSCQGIIDEVIGRVEKAGERS